MCFLYVRRSLFCIPIAHTVNTNSCQGDLCHFEEERIGAVEARTCPSVIK